VSTLSTTNLKNPSSGSNNIVLAADGSATITTLTGTTITGTSVRGVITSGTAVASTSGTSIDFTGIPSWVKRVTVMFNGVSTNGTSNYQVQLGAGSIATSGYTAYANINTNTISSSSGLIQTFSNTTAAATVGYVVLTLFTGSTWLSNGQNGRSSDSSMSSSSGAITLSGTLDRVRITTVNGDTFDAGSINILYEG